MCDSPSPPRGPLGADFRNGDGDRGRLLSESGHLRFRVAAHICHDGPYCLRYRRDAAPDFGPANGVVTVMTYRFLRPSHGPKLALAGPDRAGIAP